MRPHKDTTPPQGDTDYHQENEIVEVAADGTKQRVTRTGRPSDGQGKRDSFRRSLFNPNGRRPQFQKLSLGGRRA